MKTPSPTIGRTIPEQDAHNALGARLRGASAEPDRVAMPVACLTPLAESSISHAVYVVGHTATLGRGDAADVVFDDAAMSRIHCEISLSPEGWCITDKGSLNGTDHNGTRLAPHHPVRLGSRDRIRLASACFQFHSREDGDPLFGCLVEAEHTGLCRRDVLIQLVEQKLRQGRPLFLLALDVDDYSRFLRGDRGRAYDILDRLVRELSMHVARDANGAVWGPFRVGDNTLVVCFEGYGYENAAAQSTAIHRGAAVAIRSTDSATVSAALVCAQSGTHAPAALSAIEHKLTHARLIGPGATSLGLGPIAVYRTSLQALAEQLPSYITAIRVRAPAETPAIERAATVRQWLAEAATGLSGTQCVAFGWTPDGHVGALLTTETVAKFGVLAQQLDTATFEVQPAMPGLLEWVHDWTRAESEPRPTAADTTFVLAQLLAEYESSAESERQSHLPAQLEAAMRFLACSLVGAEMYRAFRDDDRTAFDAQAHLLMRTLCGSLGPGSWLRLIEELASRRGVVPARTPVAALLDRKEWNRKARAGAEARNDSVHDLNPEERRQRLFGKMRAAMLASANLFVDSETTLYSLREVRQSQKSPGRYRADGVRLTGLSPAYGPLELEAAYLCPGVWIETGSGPTREMLLVSPLVHYQKCPECGRADMFTLDAFDGDAGQLRLAGSLHHHALRVSPNPSDEFAWDVLSALKKKVRPAGREGFSTMTELPAFRL